MNISDFIERSNPEDMVESGEEAFEAKTRQQSENRLKIQDGNGSGAGMTQNMVIAAVVTLCAAGSLGLGILAQQGSGSSAGLVVSSVPMTHPKTATLSASVLDAATAASGSASSSIPSATGAASIPSGGEFVGDSTTHTYYLPWCTQAGKIAKADEVWFANEPAAKAAGYTPGKACSGI